ncbi:MAG: flagellin N-terminal helical domain-containing protein [Sagittula sp.]|uniref:flagellin n=1 Tax=unclassified Sagittula TaxID=2624628 RepID=UPI0018E2264C|nr:MULTISPECIES: flagellin [unclassified Sagittula]WHZ36843.1 flagellin [Sagittula sp. MA-2]
MSSILTNTGAMTALQTLKMVNRSLTETQGMISTGKRVATAKDNSAVWAISKAMESDVAGFKRISDSLSLGQATIDVARKGAETVTELLTQVKEKIVASQEENVDRNKIQTDINALRDQIAAVVGASQFNGQYLLENTEQTANSGGINVLASIDRSGDGTVSSTDIRVAKQDLGTGSSSIGASLTALTGANNDITGDGDAAAYVMTGAATAPTGTTTFGTASTDSVAAGTGFSITITGTAGNGLAATSGRNDISYVARDGDTMADVVAGLAASFNSYATNDLGAGSTVNATVQNGNEIVFTGHDNTGDNFSMTVNQYDPSATTTIGGRLSALADVNVTTQTGADAALTAIDGLIDIAIDSAAAFGSAQMRIETQSDFVSGLTDALKSGIGTLVDADMEETSARLQALQVQQQLSIQAMSIANQAPQSLLSLFR